MANKKKGTLGATSAVEFARYEVLKSIQLGLKVSEIAKYRKVQRSSIYKVLSTLRKKGLVVKIDRGAYKLSEEGIKGLHSFVAFRYKLKQHNLGIKIKILESPKNWEQKRNELRLIPYYNKTIKLKNNEQDLFNFGRLQVRTTTKSMILKLPTIYATDWEEAIIQAMQIFEDTIHKLEHHFKVKLVKDYKANIKIISQEYARIQDALAKLYRAEGNRIYLSGEDGKIWLITDFSFSNDELELIHPERAIDDLDAIAPFLNDLRKNPTTLSNIREETKEVLQVAKASMQNEVKHQRVLDEILLAFKKINIRLDKAGL
jgi:DNA-binding PadR family transcriptional regulator